MSVTVERSEVSSRFTLESSPQAILERVAEVNGLPKHEALLLAEWLAARGQNFIAVVDQPEHSVVVWKK